MFSHMMSGRLGPTLQHDGRKLEFFLKPNVSPLRLVDVETASEWDFAGKAVAGPLAGRELARVALLDDY